MLGEVEEWMTASSRCVLPTDRWCLKGPLAGQREELPLAVVKVVLGVASGARVIYQV